jgi:sec-independent protein translocase protein TatC
MTLLSVPIYLLYELGMILARILVPGSRQVDAQHAEQEKSKAK